MKLIILS